MNRPYSCRALIAPALLAMSAATSAQVVAPPTAGPVLPGGGAQAASPVEPTPGRTAVADQPVEQANTGLGDIVVTARRREESARDVPVTITALGAEALARATLRSTADLRTIVPGLNISGQARDADNFFIRGQGPGSLTGGARNYTGVATYFAEVPTNVSGPGVFFDIASVQVLKGPQGTLFGRNTTGGAVLFEPTRPQQENGGYVQLQAGNYDLRQFNAVLNVAIVPDKVALRVAAEVARRDGFTRSIVTDQRADGRRYDAARASLLLTPTGWLENLTIVDYRFKDQTGTGQVIRALDPNATLSAVPIPQLPTIPGVGSLNTLLGLPVGARIPARVGGAVPVACAQVALPGCPTGPFGAQLAALVAAYNGGNFADGAGGFFLAGSTAQIRQILATQQQIGARRNQANFPVFQKNLDWSVTNKTAIDLTDTLRIKNIVAFRSTRAALQNNFTGTPLDILNSFLPTQYGAEWGYGTETLTEELQLQGRIPSLSANYIIGGYYEEEEPGLIQNQPGRQLGNFTNRIYYNNDSSRAVFGHVEINPLDWLGLSGGVRQTWDRRSQTSSIFNAAGVCSQVNPIAGSRVQCPVENSVKSDALTYDGTVSVKPVRGLLLYGSFRRGYKAGGLNIPIVPAPAPLPLDSYATYGPETVDSFELGVKADFRIGFPVRIDAAAFRDKYDNAQFGAQVPFANADGTTNATFVIFNDVRARNQGVEVSVEARPVPALTLASFFSYLDAVPLNTIPGVSIAGRQLSNQPKYKYGFNGAFTLPVAATAGAIVLSANYSHQSTTFNENAGLSLVQTYRGYGLLNARIDWNGVMGSRIDLGGFVTNVTDKTYILGGYPVGQLGFDSVFYGEPRMYGLSLKLRFGAR